MKINIPASKSYAQRAVVCALLAEGRTVLRGVDMCDDIRAALSVIEAMGAKVEQQGRTIHIEGVERPRGGVVCTRESGLSTRLFSSVAALADSEVRIEGHGSILTRPMDMVEEAVEALGVGVESNNHCLPLTIAGGGIEGGGEIELDGSISSQVLTGVLTALPRANNSTNVKVLNLTSKPYIDITLDLLKSFGVEIENHNYELFRVAAPQHYKAIDYTVEGDWSGASYFLVAQYIWGREIEIDNLNYSSVQADRAILSALELAKDGKAIDFDATQCPDLFPTLVALCSFLDGTSRIKGLGRLKHKESDRGVVLKQEFAKFGVVVDIESEQDVMLIVGEKGRKIVQTEAIDPHGDHRIAMATAIMGRGIEIVHKEVAGKSFEKFWVEWAKFEETL